VPSFAAVATTGQGVFATLNAISRLLLQKFARETHEAANKQRSTSFPQALTALSGMAARPTGK
jgi:hypothetical protein